MCVRVFARARVRVCDRERGQEMESRREDGR